MPLKKPPHPFSFSTDSGLIAGVTSPVITAFVVLVVGSIAAYTAYKNNKLCFKPRGKAWTVFHWFSAEVDGNLANNCLCHSRGAWQWWLCMWKSAWVAQISLRKAGKRTLTVGILNVQFLFFRCGYSVNQWKKSCCLITGSFGWWYCHSVRRKSSSNKCFPETLQSCSL